jgi:hypothetical protein
MMTIIKSIKIKIAFMTFALTNLITEERLTAKLAVKDYLTPVAGKTAGR